MVVAVVSFFHALTISHAYTQRKGHEVASIWPVDERLSFHGGSGREEVNVYKYATDGNSKGKKNTQGNSTNV